MSAVPPRDAMAGSASAAGAAAALRLPARNAVTGSGLSLAAVAAQFAPPPPVPPPRRGSRVCRPSAPGCGDVLQNTKGDSGCVGGGGDIATGDLGDVGMPFPEGSPFTADLFTLPPPSPPLQLREDDNLSVAQAAAAAVLDAVHVASPVRSNDWAAPAGPAGKPGRFPVWLAGTSSIGVLRPHAGGTSPAVGATVEPPLLLPSKMTATCLADDKNLATGPRVWGGEAKARALTGVTLEAAPAATSGAATVTVATTSSVVETDADTCNPLRKEGRNLVITGKLPTSSPFQRAIDSVGIRFVSAKLSGTGPGAPPAAEVAAAAASAAAGGREAAFLVDHAAFMLERGHASFKVPVVGGGPLNIYRLFLEVCKLGGVENVLNKRAFRVVAGELDLPRTCTSAAFVLRNAHESLLYAYEQQLVFGRTVSPSDRPVRKGVDGKKKKKKAPPLVPPLALADDIQGAASATTVAAGGSKGVTGVSPSTRRPPFPRTPLARAASSKAGPAVGQSRRAGPSSGKSPRVLTPAAGKTSLAVVAPASSLAAKAVKDGCPGSGGHAPKTPTTTIIVASSTKTDPTAVGPHRPAASPLHCPSTRRPLRPLPATPPPRRPAPSAAAVLNGTDGPAAKRLKKAGVRPLRGGATAAAASIPAATTAAAAAGATPTAGVSAYAASASPASGEAKAEVGLAVTPLAPAGGVKKSSARRPQAAASKAVKAPPPPTHPVGALLRSARHGRRGRALAVLGGPQPPNVRG